MVYSFNRKNLNVSQKQLFWVTVVIPAVLIGKSKSTLLLGNLIYTVPLLAELDRTKLFSLVNSMPHRNWERIVSPYKKRVTSYFTEAEIRFLLLEVQAGLSTSLSAAVRDYAVKGMEADGVRHECLSS